MAGKRDYHWTFGNRCHIEFQGGGAPVNVGPQAFSTEEGCASISDDNGGLLFYTDGRKLYDSANAPVAVVPATATLGGNVASTDSALIVPPSGTRTWYHIFGVDQWATPGRPVTHTAVTMSGANVVVVSQPSLMTPVTGPPRAAERLAAIQHRDCDKYWVVALYLDGNFGVFHSILVDADAKPTFEQTSPYPALPGWVAIQEYCMKFSPDGALLALAARGTIDIMTFDRATGMIAAHSQVTGCTGNDRAYGLEFSPNGRYLYFSCHLSGEIRRHTIGASGTTAAFNTTALVGQWVPTPVPPASASRVGALQLGPNGKIYGAKLGQPSLIEIGNPDDPTVAATPASVLFNATATTVGGGPLNLNAQCRLGLPIFTRMTADCDDRCRIIAANVDAELTKRSRLENSMATCNGEPPAPVQCHPLEIPPLQPQTYIHWGSSPCDCIEGDDTEIMYLTVCNPYSNLTLSNLTVHELVVVDDQGNAVPNLPDGTPSIQLVPIGPYCFDDIAPCSCVSREFVLRLRGAPGNRKYRILVRGICFDACIHGDTEACFTFDVCKD